MRIDAHQHYWTIARGDYGWLTPALGTIHRDFGPADLAPLLTSGRIDRTITVQAAPTEAETAHLIGIARSEPSVAGVVGWTDFDAADAALRIARMAAEPLLVGLRPMIHDIADPDWMLSAPVAAALAAMQRENLVFDALVRPVHLSRLLVLADRNPDLAIVIDHCAKPCIREGLREPWATDMSALALRPNVCVKLSGLVTEAAGDWRPADLAPYAHHVLARFGADRVIWGSDWPVLNLAGSYAGWLDVCADMLAGLTTREQAAIMGGNAARLYLDKRGRI